MTIFLRLGTSDVKMNTSYFRVAGLLLIFVAALTIRLFPILVTPEPVKAGFGPFGDSALYHRIAYNLCKGHGYSGVDNGALLDYLSRVSRLFTNRPFPEARSILFF